MRAEIGAQTNRQTSHIERVADCSVNFARVIFISEIGFFQLLSFPSLFSLCLFRHLDGLLSFSPSAELESTGNETIPSIRDGRGSGT